MLCIWSYLAISPYHRHRESHTQGRYVKVSHAR